MTLAAPEIYTVNGDTLEFRPHPGQGRALKSEARFTLVLAGTQGGKTVLGPLWLLRTMQRYGVGDYMVVAPSFPLLDKKVLPETVRFFVHVLKLGEYKAGRKTLELFDGSTIFFAHAADPDSLESATAKAAWLDECGQDGFKLASWEAIQRRLSIHQGPVLMTTTPYNLGWLKTQVYDRWRNGDPDYNVVQFRSVDNPAFSRAEYERARATLPPWKFRMFYEAEFTRPAGLIYDCLEDAHFIQPFAVSADWPVYGGMDFGGLNTVGLRLVENPQNGTIYITNEYHAGNRTAQQHAAALHGWGVSYWIGGAKSEGQWRQEFGAAGLPIQAPTIQEVEVGINRVYGLLQERKLYIFDNLANLKDDLLTYRRELDGNGQPTVKIAEKNTYHFADALRYGVQCVTDRGWWI